MWITIAAVLLAVLVLGWLVRPGLYRRGFRRQHFVEILDGLVRVRARAKGMEVRLPETPEEMTARDSPAIRTSIGMCILWSTVRDGSAYVHHLSVSGPALAWAFRGALIAFVLDRLGLSDEEVAIQRSGSGVDHAEVVASEERQRAIWAHPLEPVPDAEFRTYLAELLRRRNALTPSANRRHRVGDRR